MPHRRRKPTGPLLGGLPSDFAQTEGSTLERMDRIPRKSDNIAVRLAYGERMRAEGKALPLVWLPLPGQPQPALRISFAHPDIYPVLSQRFISPGQSPAAPSAARNHPPVRHGGPRDVRVGDCWLPWH